VHCTKISPESEFGGSKVKVTRDKKRRSAALFSGAVLGGASYVVRQFYADGKISACCLVKEIKINYRNGCSMMTLPHTSSWLSIYNNRKRLSVPCYFLAPCDNRKHTAHAHQQAASQASTDSAWRHPVWLPHSSLGLQRPVGRRSYRLTPQVTIARSAIVDCGL